MTKSKHQRNAERITVRLPAELKQELEAAAELNGRTVNAEVLARIRSPSLASAIESLSRNATETKAMIKEMHAIIIEK